MKFYVNVKIRSLKKQEFPFVVLEKSKWDDYNCQTTYNATYYASWNNSLELGEVKILDNKNYVTVLEKEFINLESGRYCSLGQNKSYYASLAMKDKIPKRKSLEILKGLNDIAYYPKIRQLFRQNYGYEQSLLRFSHAQKALQEGKKIFDGIPIKNSISFTYSCRIGNATEDHSVDLNFDKSSELSSRIYALVGRNGTGKTQYLASLANSLSGLTKEEGTFNTSYRPPFSKVITISYSMFDKFKKPEENEYTSYTYCGLKNKRGYVSDRVLAEKFVSSLNNVNDFKSINLYQKLLENFICPNPTTELFNDFEEKKDPIKIRRYIKKLSSGQSILLYVLLDVINHIDNETLILFDEPETHLHPNAISRIVNSFYEILNKYDSYMIIATHSPILIQQIPSKYVKLFKRIDDTPIIHKIAYETFGENLTRLTETLFETTEIDEHYKSFLMKISEKKKYREILSMFKGEGSELSLNAKIFLNSLYGKKNNEKS